MWELDHKESWAPRNRCFWTVVLEKALERVPWTARRSNQSIRKEIGPEYSLEGSMLKLQTLATWWEELTHWCWERLKAGGEGDDRGWNGWIASPAGWIRVWASSGSWWWTGKPDLLQVHRGSKELEATELNSTMIKEESLYWFNYSQQQWQ